MFQIGDKVYIEDSAQHDCTLEAWNYIDGHRTGEVAKVLTVELPTGKNIQCAVDFGAEFSGGHYCNGSVPKRTAQWITSHHLSLCFEASREVVTVPQPSEFLTDNTKWYGNEKESR